MRLVRNRAIAASILAPALCVAVPASAEIYKCVAKGGFALYQNFPCQFDSNPQGTKTALVTSNPMPTKPVVPVVAPPVKPPDPTEPRIGMDAEQVKAMLGEPMEIVPDQPSDGIETWRYLNRTLHLDRSTQQVVDVQAW